MVRVLKRCLRCGGPKERGSCKTFFCAGCSPFTADESYTRRVANNHPERKKRNWGGRQNPERRLLSSAKQRARKKGLEFNIDSTDISIPQICPVFKFALEFGKGKRGASERSPTLDRIDNRLGYVKGNVIVISWKANKMKGEATMEELKCLIGFYEGLKK